MGLFRDVHKLKQMGDEIRANSPSPGEQMAAAQAQMAQVTASMNQQAQLAQTVAADGVHGVASVLSATQTGALVNFNPTVQLELLVTAGSFPAYPVVIQSVVPQIHLARAQPGAVVPVSVARTDPSQVLADWNRSL